MAVADSRPATVFGRQAIWYRHLAWWLLALAVMRGLQVLASDPMLAIANNYDMIRVQACVDAWPVRDGTIPPAANSPAAPLERFRFVDGVDAPCFMTSEALFAWVAWPGMWMEQALRADRTFSIRWKGALQFSLWIAIAAWCTRRLLALQRSDLAAGHAVVAAVAVVDPANLLYFNTFYAESSAVLFLYAVLAGILVAVAEGGVTRRWLIVAIGVAAILLALTKIQHLLVPLVVFVCVVVATAIGRLRLRLLSGVLAAGALLGVSAQWLHMNAESNGSNRSANLVDTLFTALLPNSGEPEVLLSRLGLPASCTEQSGSSWYSPGMVSRTLCPEVFALDQVDLIVAALRDPAMGGRTMLAGMDHARSWIPEGIGVMEGGDFARLPATVPSLSPAIAAVSPSALLALICILPAVSLVLVALRRSADQVPANAVVLALGVLPLCIYVTAVLGDGYVDLSKHFHLGISALVAALVVMACLLFDRVFRRLDGRR